MDKKQNSDKNPRTSSTTEYIICINRKGRTNSYNQLSKNFRINKNIQQIFQLKDLIDNIPLSCQGIQEGFFCQAQLITDLIKKFQNIDPRIRQMKS